MAWGCWLACESIDTPACARTCDLVKFVISDAMSTFVMFPCAVARFSWLVARLVSVYCRRFWTAPNAARWVETLPIAASIVDIVVDEPRLIVPTRELIAVKLTLMVSPSLAPTWKVTVELLLNSAMPLN
jgi:hypothetical protein